MCGIAGYTHLDRAPEPGLIHRLNRDLHHRGPDQSGVHEAALVSLGAVRLKIIDLGGGNQPIYSDDRDTVIVFNGEVYNHAEIRRELESRGHRFHSSCDTEAVLRAFLEWDTACFARMRGMFGVALWQESRGRLVLARDRMGIKPLYYARHGRDLAFGSEVKSVLEHPATARTLDPDGLSLYLSVNYVPGPYTLAAAVRKVPPGHLLEWRRGETRIEPWWRLAFQPDRTMDYEDAKSRLDHLLRESVREHLVSDVPLGIWASGGLDSSAILHYAAEASPARLKTFSVSFRGREFDESPWFREVAAKYGTDHHEFDLNPTAEIGDAIEKFAYHADEPTADAGALPVWFLSRMCRSQVTVALSGEGADELFGGYLTYRADAYARWARLIPAALRRVALAGVNALYPVSDEKISLEYKLKRFLAGSLLPPDEAHFSWNGSCLPGQRAALGVAGLSPGALIASLPDGTGFVNRYLLADQHTYLVDDILMKVDRMSMAHSLEVRPPFLDHRIVEFAATLPEAFKIRGSRLKRILRDLMSGKLPASVLTRAKTGFDIPAHEWFRGPLKPLLLDTLAARPRGFLDAAALDRMVRDHMERRANFGYQLWGLLNLCLWMRRWKIAIPERSPAGSSATISSLSS